MQKSILKQPTDATQTLVSAFVFLAAGFSIAFAWGYELITGNLPCELCLAQREPYYVGIPIAAIAFLAALRGSPAVLARGMLILFALLMLYGMSIAVFHAGVEWQFWPGPEACTGGLETSPTSAANLLSQLNQPNETPVIRCDQPYFRLLGLSFAGWNVLASLFLAAVALAGALRRPTWR